MNIEVKYAINKLAGSGRLNMETKYANIRIESDLLDEEAVVSEVTKKLCKFESLPHNEIKVLNLTVL